MEDSRFNKFWKWLAAGSLLVVQTAFLWAVSPAEPGDTWTTLLQKHVVVTEKEGIRLNGVDYGEMRSDPAFVELLRQLASPSLEVPVERKEKMAFWINVYNIGAVRLVVTYHPEHSIRDIGYLFSPVWKQKAIQIAGKWYSLDEIENRILRPMGNPRIHFAIVCASISCPDLRNEAYSGLRLDEQLDDQVRRFLQNKGKGLRFESGTVRVSRIFTWFAKDFRENGGVQAFIQKYVPLEPGSRLAYLPYNWELNCIHKKKQEKEYAQ